MSTCNRFSASDAQRFFDKYYIPANMTVAVVGDVKTAEVYADSGEVFWPASAKPKPEELATVEPPQMAERRVVFVRSGAALSSSKGTTALIIATKTTLS